MTDTASISGLVRSTGTSFPSASRVRADSTGAGESGLPHRHSPTEETRSAQSGTGKPLLAGETQLAAQQSGETSKSQGDSSKQHGGSSLGSDPSNPENLSEEEQQTVKKLQQQDREVRAHEAAHKSAGGALAGSPTFKTVRGPDGRSYAVSGEVKIDTSPVPNNPEATIRKLEQVKRAALAPSNPSSQDRQVAAEASAKIQQARQEKREKEAEELKEANGDKGALETSLNPNSEVNPSSPISESEPTGPIRPASSATLSPGSLLNLVA